MRFGVVILITISFFSCKNRSRHGRANDNSNEWPLLQFVKADEVNPILIPDSTTEFFCPVRKEKLKWEEKDVFQVSPGSSEPSLA